MVCLCMCMFAFGWYLYVINWFAQMKKKMYSKYQSLLYVSCHSDDILGASMLWKPKEVRILKNFIDQLV
jgi:hypothetical protein